MWKLFFLDSHVQHTNSHVVVAASQAYGRHMAILE